MSSDRPRGKTVNVAAPSRHFPLSYFRLCDALAAVAGGTIEATLAAAAEGWAWT